MMRSRSLLVPALVVLLLAVGCSGSDGGSKEASRSTTSTTSASTSSTSETSTTLKVLDADEVDASASPYCAAWARIRAAGGAKITGDPAKDTAARKAHYAKLVPLAEELQRQAPDELEAAVQVAVDQVREVARTGSDAPFSDPKAQKAQATLGTYALDHCTKG